jgi:hypothetical protein
MRIILHEISGGNIAEISSDGVVLKDPDDALSLIYESGALDSGKMILYQNQIVPEFFDLKTRLAGEILQKFSNYRLQLAIIGDFSVYRSKSLQDFIRECNRGSTVFFVENLDAAIAILTR